MVVYDGGVGNVLNPHYQTVHPTLEYTILSDDSFCFLFDEGYKKKNSNQVLSSTSENCLCLKFPPRFYKILAQMADNIRRAVQNLDLGVDDEPYILPADVVEQAAAENQFMIIGRPIMPRHQNLRSIIANLPRIWGQAGLIHGHIIASQRFQFVFPTEESMEMVLRRGPWAFAERMLILQRWTPHMNRPLLDFIPFWIQVRGIPLQFLNENVVAHIGRAIGQLMDIDYIAEVAARVEYVRVRVN